MSRSIWKGPYIDPYIYKLNYQLSNLGTSVKQPIKIWSRNSIILPSLVGLRIHIHNGLKFFPIKIMPEMVGQKFGSFCPTRKFVRSKGKDKSKPLKK